MALIPIIRDYLDLVALKGSENLAPQTLSFFAQAFLDCIKYLVTFGWVRDLLYLPFSVPSLTSAVFSENFFIQDLNKVFFEDQSAMMGVSSLFVCGLLNSLFCCLPTGVPQLIATRRCLVQGVFAGVASSLGVILGQWTMVCLTLFGCRELIISWFACEPFNYLFGLAVLFYIVYDMATEKRLRSVELSESGVLARIFLGCFILTWTEQGTLFHYLSSLTLGPEPSLLQCDSGAMGQGSYCLGLLLGQCGLSALFIWATLSTKDMLFDLSKMPYSLFLKRANFFCLAATFSFSLSSLPYYGLDYLFTNPLGFSSQDKSLETSLFAQKDLVDDNRLLTSADVSFPLTVDTDISYFDRGDFGDDVGYFKRYFEDLNYQGEYGWLARRDRKPNLYASGETTKTVLRNFLGAYDEEQTPQADKNKQKKKKPSLQATTQTQKSPFYQKLKKRFNNQYREVRRDWRVTEGYLLGDSFHAHPRLREVTPAALIQQENTLKQKYYTNPVYKALLSVDIDMFVQRQPSDAFLSTQDEMVLAQKRSLLSKYYDTLREYQNLPYAEDFETFFNGSKSFVDRTYHHQFKGSFYVVRRLFALTLDKNANGAQKAVLSFDQPLYQKNAVPGLSTAHEELAINPDKTSSPFLEATDSSPFYLGWDTNTRQMVLTKRFLPQSRMMEMPTTQTDPESFTRELQTPISESEKPLVFTSWPMPKETLYQLKAKPSSPLITLFEPVTNPQMSMFNDPSKPRAPGSGVRTYPANMRYFMRLAERVAPNQGGFIWPGQDLLSTSDLDD